MLFMPLSFFMAACGATPSNEVRGVFFQSEKYDLNTGYAIFEVDLNVPTTLSYKVNPSTWSGYRVTYTYGDSAANHDHYRTEDGVITVISDLFEDTKVTIHINGMTDTCIVTLKKYPDRFYVETKAVNLSSSGLYSIRPIGEYKNSDNTIRTVYLTEADFTFELESSDETKVQLINQNRLDVYAVSKTSGDTAMVTVKLLDTSGKVKNYPKNSAEDVDSPMVDFVSFTIVPGVASAVLSIDRSSDFVEDGGIVQFLSGVETETLHFILYLYSENKILIQVPFEIDVVADVKGLVSVSDKKDSITVKYDSSCAQINITMVTNIFDSSGIPFTFKFSIIYSYSAS